MRIGLISDTHGKLRAEVFERLAGVERILHAGDVGDADILAELGAIAPVRAVWGNTDDQDVRRHLVETIDEVIAGKRIVVTHGDRLGSPNARLLRNAFPHADVIVYGHTHVARIDQVDGALIINPGAAGPARFRTAPSVAILTVDPLHAEILELNASS